MKRSFLVTFMILAASALSAQGIGLRGGLNLSNLVGEGASDDAKMKAGFHIGIDYEVAVAPDFYFAPGLLFSTKGSKSKSEVSNSFFSYTEEIKINLNYLEIPLNLVYKPMIGEGNLILAFGPYLGLGMGGKMKTEINLDSGSETDEVDISFGSDEDDFLKPFDMGANISFGYLFSSGLSVQLNTQLGLINISTSDDSDNAIKNSAFGLGFGYRF